MPPIQHFAPPAGVKSPPLSFAARTGDCCCLGHSGL